MEGTDHGPEVTSQDATCGGGHGTLDCADAPTTATTTAAAADGVMDTSSAQKSSGEAAGRGDWVSPVLAVRVTGHRSVLVETTPPVAAATADAAAAATAAAADATPEENVNEEVEGGAEKNATDAPDAEMQEVGAEKGGEEAASPAAPESAPLEEREEEEEGAPPPPAPAAEGGGAGGRAEAWSVDFSAPTRTRSKRSAKRKMTRKERDAIAASRSRSAAPVEGEVGTTTTTTTTPSPTAPTVAGAADSEGNVTAAGALPMVSLAALVDVTALVPRNLNRSTPEKLLERLCFRVPRLLCVNKQYPRSCGVSSLTAIYNYLYSWLGESPEWAHAPPVSQEEVMSVLGFNPPFGEIPWGSFTGNTTLIRWFHSLNRHFNRPGRGRAYILYKAHGHGKTTHLYNNDNKAILAEVKRVLRDPHCALIYHCHNHYMCPIGFQDIPLAQTDFLAPDIAEENCETTVFIGEVSRGRHEAIYARKWSEIVKDIECKSPLYFNIRRPELGIQSRAKGGRRKRSASVTAAAAAQKPVAVDSTGDGVSNTDNNNNNNSCSSGTSAGARVVGLSGAEGVGDSCNAEEEGDGVLGPLSVPAQQQQQQCDDDDDAGKTDNNCDEEQDDDEEGSVTTAGSPLHPSPPSPTTATSTTTAATTTSSGASFTAAAKEGRRRPQQQQKVVVQQQRRREPGNLHCLICFRNDEVEMNPSLYEAISDSDEDGNDMEED